MKKNVLHRLVHLGVCALWLAFAWACGPDETGEKAEEARPIAAEDKRGHQLYMSNGCAVCHGDHGRGDGRIAATLKPPPRDFRDLAHYKKGHEVEQMAETIGKGIAGTSMPGFSHLSVEDRRSMARHIAYLQQQP